MAGGLSVESRQERYDPEHHEVDLTPPVRDTYAVEGLLAGVLLGCVLMVALSLNGYIGLGGIAIVLFMLVGVFVGSGVHRGGRM